MKNQVVFCGICENINNGAIRGIGVPNSSRHVNF